MESKNKAENKDMQPHTRVMNELVRGTRDIYGSELKKHLDIIRVAREVSEMYNFKELQTPVLEKAEIFKRTLGDFSDIVNKEIYSFEDRGQNMISLRPEFTACVMRHVLSMNPADIIKPMKLFSHGPLFRYDRPQAGRYRQFSQINFEILGASGSLYDVENIVMADKILSSLGISGYEIRINYLGSNDCRIRYQETLREYFTKYRDQLSDISLFRLDANPLRILDSKDPNDMQISVMAPSVLECLSEEEKKKFIEIQSYLEGLSIAFKVDKSLVRGLDYYNGLVFEFVTDRIGAQSSILGGGRYDSLYRNMGGKTSMTAVGFAAGIDRLALLMEDREVKNEFPSVGIIPLDTEASLHALGISEMFRNNCIIAEIFSCDTKLDKKLKNSERMNLDYSLIIGEEEIKSQIYTLRNTLTKENYKLSIQGLIFLMKD